ncbi:sulfatase [Phragmitibacter flavus]|uniref:Sulfatase n=1 Tax=Phragmitibacter flavus TaxID=2576071 RepID=A0A5R8K8Q8_9BACT|nr:sulfatase [Phragmitibacter flavus]TLD68696.1 sulfatase [Phragmitibacter flavus]
MRVNILLVLLCVTIPALTLRAAERPNILLFFVDDMGFMDLGCYGSDLYRTPNIDRLAAQGTRFTRAYAAAHVCSPTRGALLTGKYPARTRVTDFMKGHERPFAKLLVPDWTMGLPESEMTLAKVLVPQGYAAAWLGKWHVGGSALSHGFQAGEQKWIHNRKDEPEDVKGAFTLNAEAMAFIEKEKGKPFFVAISHYSVHGPIRFEPGLRDEYQKIIDEKKPLQTNAGYAAMVESLDESVGQMLDWLQKQQLAESTLVIFTSDNGGAESYTNNAPLRAGKGTLYEGGVRVPLIARWPGKVAAGKTSEVALSTIDFLPTFAALAGAAVPPDVDGVDVTAVLKGAGSLERETLYWHYPHYHAEKPSGSILKGDWKLIEWFETGEAELYDLAKDVSEARNLAAEEPERTAAMLTELREWRKRVGAQMMTVNPAYDAAREGEGPPKKVKRKEAKAAKKEKEKNE